MNLTSLFFLAVILFYSCGKNSPCVEVINDDCFCTLQYDPVCGCNDKTYGNACEASCAGILETTPGECKGAYLGKWKVIEAYVDPGDGSGEYSPVDNGMKIEISSDGIVTSDGNICELNPKKGNNSTGKLDLNTLIIKPDKCSQLFIKVSLSNDHLILNHPCIEGCGMKLKRN
jgi:hypothetical protein